jgi:hypothetical protein
MPQALNVFNGPNGVFQTVRVSGNAIIGFAGTTDGSGNPVLLIGPCSDVLGNGFTTTFSFNLVTGVFQVLGTSVSVP